MRKTVFLSVVVMLLLSAALMQPAVAQTTTLRVLVHQNPPMVEFMEAFNQQFQEQHPDIVVDMSVVNANDLSTVTQTRLSANDIDVIDMFGFANAVQPYMKNVDPPNWQQLADAGLLMDLTDQPFVANYDTATIADAGTYNGKVYEINLGRVSYSGIYYNQDLFTANNVAVPTTWSELVQACKTFNAAGIPCMTAGGKDGWPIFVGAYGLIGALYPDQAALVEGLWTGTITWNDERALEMWSKMQIYARDMIESGASGIAGDAAPGRFASGAVAMFPGGTWYAPAIESAEPEFEWGYIPFPGSDNAEDNQYLFGKYDQGWAIAANTPNAEAALVYLTDFSDPENYQAFVNAVGFIPTQATAQLSTHIGEEVAPYLANFRDRVDDQRVTSCKFSYYSQARTFPITPHRTGRATFTASGSPATYLFNSNTVICPVMYCFMAVFANYQGLPSSGRHHFFPPEKFSTFPFQIRQFSYMVDLERSGCSSAKFTLIGC